MAWQAEVLRSLALTSPLLRQGALWTDRAQPNLAAESGNSDAVVTVPLLPPVRLLKGIAAHPLVLLCLQINGVANQGVKAFLEPFAECGVGVDISG